MTAVGPEPASGSTWVSASVVRKIRTGSMVMGVLSVLWSLICAGLMLGIGHRLPLWYNPFAKMAVAMGLVSAFFLFLVGSGLMVARRSTSGEHLNVPDSRRTLRLLFVLWGGTIFTSGISCLLLVLLVNSSKASAQHPEVHFSPLVAGYLLLPVSSCVLAGISIVVARHLFRSFPAPARTS